MVNPAPIGNQVVFSFQVGSNTNQRDDFITCCYRVEESRSKGCLFVLIGVMFHTKENPVRSGHLAIKR